jgi:hypothetical protein
MDPNLDYDYSAAGFDAFMDRSIDASGTSGLDNEVYQTRETNYDAGGSSGSLGDSLRVGNIKLDGVNGRISVYDDQGNEVVRIGELDG